MKISSIMRTVLWVLCVGLAAMWMYAAWFKIRDPAAFAKVIYHYKLLPDGWPVNAVAVFLPWLEAVLAAGLLLPRLQSGAIRLSTVLMMFFTVLIWTSMYRGIEGSCGCMEGERIGWPKLFENILLTNACIIAWALDWIPPPRRRNSPRALCKTAGPV